MTARKEPIVTFMLMLVLVSELPVVPVVVPAAGAVGFAPLSVEMSVGTTSVVSDPSVGEGVGRAFVTVDPLLPDDPSGPTRK